MGKDNWATTFPSDSNSSHNIILSHTVSYACLGCCRTPRPPDAPQVGDRPSGTPRLAASARTGGVRSEGPGAG
eukprot:11564259-Alexandrium_andersonii.AAC.1